jgi:hypothetical protein
VLAIEAADDQSHLVPGTEKPLWPASRTAEPVGSLATDMTHSMA